MFSGLHCGNWQCSTRRRRSKIFAYRRGIDSKSCLATKKGRYSIRINDQCRVCFRWEEGNAYDVAITDYHS